MPQTVSPPSLLRSVQEVLAAVCLVAINLRWFIPAEDTADGATLWLAAFWCVIGLAASFCPFAHDAIARRWTRADAAVSLLVGGHALGGLLVLVQGGQRQLAANLLVEWLGLAALWSVARDLVRVPKFRAALWQSTLMSLTVIAMFGCWQHWIELPSTTQRLGPKFDAVRAARAVGSSDPAEQELAREGVPLTEPEFTLFEKRLRDSREPFGFFALTNTLGGFLAAGLVLLFGNRISHPVAGQRRPFTAVEIVAAVFLGTCLLLTKSRTAWLAVGLCAAAVAVRRVLRGRTTAVVSSRTIIVAGVCLIGLVVVGGLLLQFGSWDREVLAEAPKSLLYRWQYWTGTARLIAEQPVLGGGLGQFRSAYLRVKSPAASEEIADPHNFLLDVWYNGGVLGLAGALWLVATLMVTTWKAAPSDASAPVTTSESTEPEPRWLFAGGLAPWAAFGVQLVGIGAWDDRLVVVGLALIGWFTLIIYGQAAFPGVLRAGCGLSALVVCLHLLGAGGIGYTTVTQFLLLLLAGTFSPTVEGGVASAPVTTIKWFQRGGLIATTIVVWLIWNPMHRAKLESADALAVRGAPTAVVRAAYLDAKTSNPWDPVPCSRLAELTYRELQTGDSGSGEPKRGSQDIAAVTDEFLSATRRDPANGQWWHRMGTVSWEWWKRYPSAALAEDAARFLSEAVKRYPTNARWQADLADAAAAAGNAELAAQSARAALAQDEVNQRLGHIERRLAADVLARLVIHAHTEPIPRE